MKLGDTDMLGKIVVPPLNDAVLSQEINGRHSVTPRECVLLAIIFALLRTLAPNGKSTYISAVITKLFEERGGIVETTQLDSGFIITAEDNR